MNKYFLLIILWILGSISIAQESDEVKIKDDYVVKVIHIYQGEGYSITYLITKDSLYVSNDCQQIDCKKETVYKTSLKSEDINELETLIDTLKLDTLMANYEKTIEDGLLSIYSWKNKNEQIQSVQVQLDDIYALNKLMNKIDSFIEKKKFRFNKE